VAAITSSGIVHDYGHCSMPESSIKGEFVRTLNRRIEQWAREKLKYLDSAIDLRDLMIPPSNQRMSASGSGKSPKMQSACA